MANSANVVTVTDENFQAAIAGAAGLAVVDFGAEWCGPCRILAPVVDQLADEYAGRVTVGKLDVDANQQTATRFNVRTIPTVLFFRDGQVVDTIVGALPKSALARKFEQHA